MASPAARADALPGHRIHHRRWRPHSHRIGAQMTLPAGRPTLASSPPRVMPDNAGGQPHSRAGRLAAMAPRCKRDTEKHRWFESTPAHQPGPEATGQSITACLGTEVGGCLSSLQLPEPKPRGRVDATRAPGHATYHRMGGGRAPRQPRSRPISASACRRPFTTRPPQWGGGGAHGLLPKSTLLLVSASRECHNQPLAGKHRPTASTLTD